MKTRLVSQLFSLAVVIVGLPLVGGCSPSSVTDTNTNSANAAAPRIEAAAPTNAPSESAIAPAPSAAGETNAPATASAPTPVIEQTVPSHLRLSAPLAEVVKLVQAGTDETVLHSFITNNTGVFGLSADEIVYLNDLGVSGEAITAMMARDQALRELRMNAVAEYTGVAAQVTPVEEPIASAPAYEEPLPTAPTEPTVEVSESYFYETLSPYGTWVYVNGYGNCWRPTVTVTNPRWRPYLDRGRWIYTDSGWYWYSDYTWGAVAFHYGRWFNHPSWGWCWWPDRVWAPSWVTWRYSGSYCGWAPLPPTASYLPGFGFSYYGSSVGVSFGFGLGASAYAFVPWVNFYDARPYRHCLPPHHAQQAYHNSTIINNYGNGNHNRVVNRGIDPDRVREHTRSEIRTVSLRDSTGRGPRQERLERDGRTLAVHRPQLAPSNGGGENRIESPARNVPRTESARANEFAPRSSQPVVAAPARSERPELRVERDRVIPGRGAERTVTSVVPVESPTVVTPPASTPERVEARPAGQRNQRIEVGSPTRNPAGPTVGAQTPATRTPPAVTPTATPRVSEPRVIQVPAARPGVTRPSTSVVVIGGNNSSRSSGRDYSVWSTPSSPTSNERTGSGRTVAPSAPSPVANSPQATPSRPNRVESRSSQPAFSTPTAPSAPAVSTPRPTSPINTPAARPSFTPRPAPASPSPSFTPRPAPSAPSTESRAPSAPAAPAARAESGPSRPGR